MTVVMRERKEPEFIKFAVGDLVEGVLVKIEPNISIADKDESGKETGRVSKSTRYTVRKENGELVCFLGTHQINQKLLVSDRGHAISICYTGENKEVTRNGNAMREFKIMISEKPVLAGAASLEITDDDIPF